MHEHQQRKEALKPNAQRHEFLVRKPAEPADSDASEVETEIEGSDDPEGETDGSADDSVVKIMSEDPMAAARAAAILKMVHTVSTAEVFINLII